jgi:hypothetical protein
VKFSFRQILASTGGAVIAAIIASTFGVKGTIIGVAIGSAAATIGTAFVAQSIERGHEAVKQVVVKAPDTALLLRRLGGTGASGDTSAPTQVMGRTSPTPADEPGAGAGAGAETTEMASSAAPIGETDRLEISAVADAPAAERLQATTRPMAPAVSRSTLVARGFSWQTIAVSAVIVFVLALLLITAIELISGKPLSAIFGGADTGTSVKNLINPPPAAPTTTSTTSSSTTTSTTGSSTSTTTSTVPTTTSSTTPTGESTTTTSPAPSLTTTTLSGGGGGSTTTSVP